MEDRLHDSRSATAPDPMPPDAMLPDASPLESAALAPDRPPPGARLPVRLLIFGFPFAVLLVIALLPLFVEGVVVRDDLIRERRDGGAAGVVTLAEQGERLRPGDRLRLRLEGRRPLHVYAVTVDSRGVSRMLWPDAGDARDGAPAPAGATIELPPGAGGGLEVVEDIEFLVVFVYLSESPIVLPGDLAARVGVLANAAARGEGLPTEAEKDAAFRAHVTLYKVLSRSRGIFARRFDLAVDAAALD